MSYIGTSQGIDDRPYSRADARHARELAMLTDNPRLRAELLRVAAEMDADDCAQADGKYH